jgi:TMEM175 potassium channel family protein
MCTRVHRYGAQHHAISPAFARSFGKRFLIDPTGYGLATILAFVNPWLSIAVFIVLNMYFLWPRDHSVRP